MAINSNFDTELYDALSKDYRNFDRYFDGIELIEGIALKTPKGRGHLVDFQLVSSKELFVRLKNGEAEWMSSLQCRVETMLNI